MAGADVIEAAIGITLLVFVSYVVVGSIITTANTVTTAQKDITNLQEARLNTQIVVTYVDQWWSTTNGNHHELEFRIKNTGNTKINYTKLCIIVIIQNQPYACFINTIGDGWNWDNPVGTWEYDGIHQDEIGTDETVNLNQWDPGEYLYGWIALTPHPYEFWAFTPNGATSSLFIPTT
jgi:flagellar protein FlaF